MALMEVDYNPFSARFNNTYLAKTGAPTSMRQMIYHLFHRHHAALSIQSFLLSFNETTTPLLLRIIRIIKFCFHIIWEHHFIPMQGLLWLLPSVGNSAVVPFLSGTKKLRKIQIQGFWPLFCASSATSQFLGHFLVQAHGVFPLCD